MTYDALTSLLFILIIGGLSFALLFSFFRLYQVFSEILQVIADEIEQKDLLRRLKDANNKSCKIYIL